MEVILTNVSKLAYFTHLGDVQPTYIGVILHLLSTMDIPVRFLDSPGSKAQGFYLTKASEINTGSDLLFLEQNLAIDQFFFTLVM